ncbi:Leucine-rich repeat-containing protein 45, partial [Rhizoclosmatium hyalinum]
MFAEQFEAECAVLGACESAVEAVKNSLKSQKEKEKDKNKVVLQGHCIDQKALTALCTVLSKDVLISSICLADTFLGDDGAILLAGCLKKNGTIAHLDLRGNNIRSDGAIALAQMLKMNNSLRSLMLEWNCLGIWETGIKALADAIASNDGLEVLDLRNCKLSPQGVNMLSLGLKQNKALRELDLRWNSGGLVGGRGLLQCMKHNHVITKLNLVGNEIPEDLLRAIESCVERNNSRHEETMKSKMNADFLSSTFQQLAQNHQNTIESLSTKLELSKEAAGTITGKLAAVTKELLETNESKRVLENTLKEKEKANAELQSVISGLQKELFNEKERISHLELNGSKTSSSLHVKIKDLETITKDMDLQISVLKKDKAFLVDELDKVKRREKDRADLHNEKLERLEQAQHRRIMEVEADKEREFVEKTRVYEDRVRAIELQKAKIAEEFDRAKSDFMAEKHKLLDLVSDTEVKIRNDE